MPLILSQLDDEIACQKKRVESTLDRLAQRVAMEKKERAQKCRAFKVRQLGYQTLLNSRVQCPTPSCLPLQHGVIFISLNTQ